MELIVDHTHVEKAPHKMPIVVGTGNFQEGEHIHNRRVRFPNFTGTEISVVETLPDLALKYLSGCPSVPFIIPYSKLLT